MKPTLSLYPQFVLLGWLVISLCFLAACQKGTAETASMPDDGPGTITLIFHHPPVNSRYQLVKNGPSTGRSFEVAYIDDAYQFQGISLNHEAQADTHQIEISRAEVEVIHLYKAVGEIPFRFQKGDTAAFYYDKAGMPHAKVLNRAVDSLALNFDVHLRQRVQADTFSALEKLHHLIMFFDNKRPNFDIAEQIPLQEQEWAGRAQYEIGELKSYLDSVAQAPSNSFSAAELAYWESRLDLQELELQAYAQKEVSPSYFVATSELADTWGHTRAFTMVLDRAFYKGILTPMQTIKGEKRFYKDFRRVFEQIEQDSLVSGLAKELLLQRSLDGLYEHYPQEDFESYFARYKKIAGKYVPAQALASQYMLPEIFPVADSMGEIGMNDSLAYQDILARHRGKVIYVDFWATWCAPCIASFPDAQVLKQDYVEQDIVFVYLAADKTYKSWKEKVWKYPLGKESFWIGNQMEGPELKGLAVKTLPRYLIYDREGKLVHRNAPGPGEPQTREFLDRYLHP